MKISIFWSLAPMARPVATKISGIAPLPYGKMRIYGVGATTGPTGGSFSHIKSDLHLPWDRVRPANTQLLGSEAPFRLQVIRGLQYLIGRAVGLASCLETTISSTPPNR
jgi:hypothetical protein